MRSDRVRLNREQIVLKIPTCQNRPLIERYKRFARYNGRRECLSLLAPSLALMKSNPRSVAAVWARYIGRVIYG